MKISRLLTLYISLRLLVTLRIYDLYFQSFWGATIFTLLNASKILMIEIDF